MDRHYFIGIKAPASICGQVETFRERLQLADTYKVLPHMEDLHITLFFIGAMPEEKLGPLSKALSETASSHKGFHLEFSHLSFFGSPKGPRVVYIGTEKSDPLASLQRDVHGAAASLTGKQESNRFTPHMTIAKKRKSDYGIVIEKENFTPIGFDVAGFSLFAIHPERTPKYEQAAYFTLQ